MAEQANGQAADAAGQAQAQTQGGAAATGDPAAQIAELQALLEKERGIKLELIAERDKRKATERAATADADRQRAEEAAKSGDVKTLRESLAEAQRMRETAETETRKLRMQVLAAAKLAAVGVAPSEVTEAYLERALSSGKITVEGATVNGLDEAVAALVKHIPATGGQRAAQSTGHAAQPMPSYATLRPGELATLPAAEQRRIVAEATASQSGGLLWPSLHGTNKTQ